jgi:hypothetical protein
LCRARLDTNLTPMATPSRSLIQALRATVVRLQAGATFQWAHMGHCNCGHLAQSLTSLEPAEIHRRALQRSGDWTTQALEIGDLEHCPATGLPIDEIFRTMLEAGLTTRDIADLESLSSRVVLAALPPEARELDKRNRDHAVLYLRTWAQVLEEQLALSERDVPERSGEYAIEALAPVIARDVA